MTPGSTPAPAIAAGDALPQHHFNRELSWLKFNQRVLHEATDDRTPLLERLRFLGIFTSNLDEFFMKRVGGLKRQIEAGVSALSLDGMTASQQIASIRAEVTPMLVAQGRCYTADVRPALAAEGVVLRDWDDLTDHQRADAVRYYQSSVFPVLTPMAVDPGHPFPFISNLSLSLGVKLCHPGSDALLFARVKVPEVLPGWFHLPSEDNTWQFVSLIEILRHNLDSLFPGMMVISATPFRVTRNADVERDEEDAEDLLELISQELRDRRFERIVRLEHGIDPDMWTLQFLMRELELVDQDVYELPGLLDYADLAPVANLDLPTLRYPVWNPVIPPRLADDEADIFGVIRARDLLVHHPFDSFGETVDRLIRSAAHDPRVVAIKITLYRIGDSKALMDSLVHAAESGKQVVCLVELKARFDEQRNIFWAQQLERAGVHVVYGVVGLKTHTKLAMVIRQDNDGLRCYVHIGTGNYNLNTARLYTDFGLFTCNPALTAEVVELFHYLTGRSLKRRYHHLLVAPVNMRSRFMALIDREVSHCRAGRPSGIIAKMNSLEDRRIIAQLCEASQAGVPITLIVRGFCCLRPGVPGSSAGIQVSSIIGRFLEHSRLFYFRNGAADAIDGRFFIGSADWMYRNLERRVEVVVPVDELKCRQRLWEALAIQRVDQRQAWDLQPDGRYVQRDGGPEAVGSHDTFMAMAREAAAKIDGR